MSNSGQHQDENSSDPVLSLEGFPDPAAVYSIQDGKPIVEYANRAYVSAFEGDPSGRPVSECWNEHGVKPADCPTDELCEALAAGETVRTEVVHVDNTGDHTDDGRKTVYQFRSKGSVETTRSYDGSFILTRTPSGTAEVDADRIASVISHDLRNPLDVAKARLRAARETGEEEHFERLERAHDRMEQIIQDVLTLARGESAITLSGSVSVETVAQDAWATVTTGSASLTLDDDLPVIEADPDRLRRLFENLFRNSIEHGREPESESRDAEESDPSIEVQVGRINGGFYVSDTGPGIPAEDHEHVFMPGYSSQETGTGLGLTIVRQIAQAHGWTVSLDPETENGARFEFHHVWNDDGSR